MYLWPHSASAQSVLRLQTAGMRRAARMRPCTCSRAGVCQRLSPPCCLCSSPLNPTNARALGQCMDLATQHLEGARNPLAAAGAGGTGSSSTSTGGLPPFYMVVETHGSVAEHDQSKLDAFLEVGEEEEGVCAVRTYSCCTAARASAVHEGIMHLTHAVCWHICPRQGEAQVHGLGHMLIGRAPCQE